MRGDDLRRLGAGPVELRVKLIPTWPFVVAALAAGLIAGLAVGAYAQQIRIANLKAAHAVEAQQRADEALAVANANARLKDAVHDWRQKQGALIADIDARITQEVSDARKETETRLRGLAAGTVRVRYVKATCPGPSSDLPTAPSTSSVGDGAGIELTPDAGRDVLVLRQALIEDRAKIEYLQGYIRSITQPVPALGLKAGGN
jgi:prophage endopeptidase